jgi:hypothetical protein
VGDQLRPDRPRLLERNGSPVKLLPAARFEWERQIKRMTNVPTHVKQFAVFVGTYSTATTGRDVRPGLTLLADDIGLSRRQVIRNLHELQRLGLLELLSDGSTTGRPREGRRGMASVYRLTLPIDASTRYSYRADAREDT